MPPKGYNTGQFTTHISSIRMTQEMKDSLKELATENGTTSVHEIRMAIEAHVIKGSIPARLNRLEKYVYGKKVEND